METSQYIKQVLQEHLLSKDYQELTQQEAVQKLEQVKSTLKEILTANANQLSKAENTFSKRASQPSTESPYFMASQKCTRHHSHYNQ
jgi:chemotaxis regulatin CheY-phosphate phosphatase CheZ